MPARTDPNYEKEMERRKRDPISFGMTSSAVEPECIFNGSGLSADREKEKESPEDASTWDVFLDRQIPKIIAQFAELDNEQLQAMIEAEKIGAQRKKLIVAAEEEFNNRQGA